MAEIREPSLREKLEGPRVVREILAATEGLLDLIEADGLAQSVEIRDAKDDLRAKFTHLDAVRRG